MKRIIITFAFILLNVFIASAQPSNKLINDVSMPPPNAASLGKYGDIPVSYYTGVPSTSIPIYTVQEGPLSLGISASYHTSGIRVAETASWIGLGWTLNAGGMITRTVRGTPDDGSGGYLTSGSSLIEPLDSGNLALTNQLEDVSQGQLDSEPDLFSFNVPGGSGKFVLDKNGDPFFMPKSDMKVNYTLRNGTYGEIIQFEVISTDGTRYLFGKLSADSNPKAGLEYVEYDGVSAGQLTPSSWYLRRIISADDNYEISLEYEAEKYKYRSLGSTTYQYAPTLYGSSPLSVSGINIGTYTGAINNNVTGWRLSQIVTNTTTVDFIEGAERADLSYHKDSTSTPKAKYLDRIEIKSGTISDQEFCTQFQFSYSYIDAYVCPTAASATNGGAVDYEDSELKRLRLDSIQQLTCGGISPALQIPPYTFEYYSGDLPPRLSKATDHWGYYNGACENEKTLNIPPNTDAYWDNGADPVDVPTFTANRESVESYMKYGVLNKINYPTGGSTSLDLEGNRIKAFSAATYKEYLVLGVSNCTYPGPGNCCSDQSVFATETFTSTEVSGNVQYKLMLYDGRVDCSISTIPQLWFKISGSDGTSAIRSFDYGQGITCNGPCTVEEDITNLLPNGLQAGVTYTFELKSSHGNGKVDFSLFKEVTQTSQAYDRIVGGLRIKQIVIDDGSAETDNDIIRNYSYTGSPTDSYSSGKLYREPQYYGYQYCNLEGTNTVCGSGINNPDGKMGLTFFANSVAPLSNVNGYHIGYERVVESSPGNGETVYFHHKENIGFGTQDDSYPYAPDPTRVRDGHLTTSSTYEEGSTTPTSSLTNNYLDEGYQELSNNVIYMLKTVLIGDPSTQTNNAFYFVKKYKPRTAPFRMNFVTKVQDGISTTTSYEYNSLNNYLAPTAVSVVNSNNTTYRTEYQYPHDVGGQVMNSLIARNIIAQPVITEQYAGTNKIGGNKLEYAYYNGDGTLATGTYTDTFPYVHRFEAYYADADGMNGYWEEKGKILSYWTNTAAGKAGFPKEFFMTDWDETETYDWENGLIKSRQYKDFTWFYDYYAETRLVKTITDIDGQQVNYSYDGLMRLKEASARDGKAKTTYEYAYQGNGATQNYVKTKSDFEVVALSSLDIQETYQYLDGLGRPIQTIQKGYSDDNNDIVQLTEYDDQGRPYKIYEPYEVQGSSGAYLSSQNIPQGLLQYYTLTDYEASPLSRKTAVTPPDWYATQFEYGSNVASITIAGITYPANSLIVQTVIDPDGHKDITYTDKKGRQLMTVRESDDGAQEAKTQYKYDNKDRLVTVIPPDANESANFKIFQYQYDERDRITAKRLPDQGGWTYYQYDDRDLVTYMQDPMMRSRGQWLHTQYDDYGREVQTGLINTVLSIDPNQSATFDEPLTKNYYDGYDFSGGAPAIYTGKLRRSDVKILGTNYWLTSYSFYDDYGRVARSESNHHLNLGNGQAEVVTFNYDFADNVTLQNRTHTRSDGTTTTILDETHYDHSARMIEAYHQIDGGTKVQLSELAYTAKDQIQNKKIGGTATSFLQQVNFQYLPNGFLEMMNSSNLSGVNSALPTCANGLPAQAAASSNVASNALFYMELGYDEQIIADANNPVARNGNISQMIWRVRGRDRQLYSYEYDYLNRLKDADYFDVNGSSIPSSDGKYTTNITYEDKRGNIASITRNSYLWDGSCWNVGQIDNLGFDYYPGTNRLKDVADTAPDVAIRDKGFKYYDAAQTGADYDYDLNGNMIYDPSKAMTVEYNYLNMPTVMEFPDCKIIEFIYDAGGSKLSKVVRQDENIIKRKDYLGGIEYVNSQIEAIYHSEGRVYYEDGTGRYEYNLTDHLGNVRLSFTDKNGNGIIDATDNPETNEILSETHYYPFGMTMEGPWMQNAGRENPYLYNGKELNEELGLNWSSYGAREYDASIGRWMSVDPLAERRIWVTPYNFVQNNPLIRIDPDGLTDYTLNRKTGEVTQVGDSNDQPDRILKTNRKGEVRYNNKGEARIAIDDIEQGILRDGMNLKDDSHLIEVGGEGQPTENGVESFALKLSEYIVKEIGGAYFSKGGVNGITHMTIGKYARNDDTSTKDFGNNLSVYFEDKTEIYNYTERGLFHTHPDLSVGSRQHKERFIPSDDDIGIRNDALRRNPNLQFFILTNPRNTGDKFPLKIPYTKD